jgi:chorismate mutase/prephenate dehydratase
LKICGEVVLRIHQNLLSNETDFSQITKVYSHAQSLAQCHEWLNRMLPKAQRISVGSNAQAAQKAAEEPGTAAIAGEAAAARYNLPKLVENIEDEPNNTTRFLILGKHDAGPSGRDKTSLIMSAPNRTGACTSCCSRCPQPVCRCAAWSPARHATPVGVCFLRRYRRPSRRPAIKAALDKLAASAAYLKILGSYPVAVY